jgi:hypothetical protein
MPIIKQAICDNCGAQAPLHEAIDGDPFMAGSKWFIVNTKNVYCSEECWKEHKFSEKEGLMT